MDTSEPVDALEPTGARPRYDKYKNSGAEWIGEIPVGWEIARLKFLADFTGGGTPSKDNQEYWDGEIPWVSPKDMKAGRVTETQDQITSEAVEESSTRLVGAGSVLVVVRSGILKHTIPVATNEVEVALNQDLKAITPRERLHSRYLAYLIEGRNDTLQLKWTKSGTTVESLEQEQISNTQIPVPSLEEQRAIAAFLDRETERIDALIEKKEQLIDLLEEKRTALISRVVTKGLDQGVEMQDSGAEWVGDIPAHWEVLQLRRCVSKFIDYRGATPKKVDEGVPLITAANIEEGEINFDEVEDYITEEDYESWMVRGFPEPGDVMITTEAPLGKVAQIESSRVALAQRIILFKTRDEYLNDRYLSYYLRGRSAQADLHSRATGSTAEGIKASRLREISVVVPPLDEQKKIGADLDNRTNQLDALMNRVQNGISRLKEYRTALISAAVTGQIDVRNEVKTGDENHERSLK
jgi:type I restriction enzyme S subunit